ncbi:CLUMA_CG009022, isoform A [Clunio marinus]|uniref:CLUMA_CG009022, isoform A n=1 Tax=Clunio marinus TaxID=568069 RepID=A0A1J1I9B1_9DIPT|nr:CLUMA_CG009022, isoform A [Clunio marinus]
MVSSYSITSPYSKIQDFNSKTKVVCENTDLSMFFDQCKVIFIGDEKCGKTSLVNRFTLSSFEQEYKPTLDINYNLKYFDVLNTEYNVGFWDMPGQESLKLITRSHFKNANVIVVVFDLTRPQTLMNAIKWMEEALAENDKSNPLRFIVGNKSDLLSKKAFEGLEAHARIIAQDLDAEYISVSSKEGTEVNNLFRRFTSLAFDKSVQKLIMPSDYNKVKNNISNMPKS